MCRAEERAGTIILSASQPLGPALTYHLPGAVWNEPISAASRAQFGKNRYRLPPGRSLERTDIGWLPGAVWKEPISASSRARFGTNRYRLPASAHSIFAGAATWRAPPRLTCDTRYNTTSSGTISCHSRQANALDRALTRTTNLKYAVIFYPTYATISFTRLGELNCRIFF
jgi:hypothetical protein